MAKFFAEAIQHQAYCYTHYVLLPLPQLALYDQCKNEQHHCSLCPLLLYLDKLAKDNLFLLLFFFPFPCKRHAPVSYRAKNFSLSLLRRIYTENQACRDGTFEAYSKLPVLFYCIPPSSAWSMHPMDPVSRFLLHQLKNQHWLCLLPRKSVLCDQQLFAIRFFLQKIIVPIQHCNV